MTVQETMLDKARRVAGERGVTISEVIEDALRKHLAESPEIPEKPFRLVTVKGRLVNPRIDLDRTSELLADDDRSAYGR